MKTMKTLVAVMTLMIGSNASANNKLTNEMQLMTSSNKMEITTSTQKTEYDLSDGKVVGKTVYTFNENTYEWEPSMKYAVSQCGENSMLSCGRWNEETQSFDLDIQVQNYNSTEFPSLLNLPKRK